MQCFKSFKCWLLMVIVTFQKHKVLRETLFGEEGFKKRTDMKLAWRKKRSLNEFRQSLHLIT